MKQKMLKSAMFDDCLLTALRHFADVEWLGANSPLAQPYFLGLYVAGTSTVKECGLALQKAIVTAWEGLWDAPRPENESQLLEQFRDSVRLRGKGNTYFALVLELRYLHRIIPLNKPVVAWKDILNVSKAQYHRDLTEAAKFLGERLLKDIHPHLRLERPTPPSRLYGRQQEVEELSRMLRSGSANLSGMSGMGKTSIAAAVCQAWPERFFFWYTVRQHLNDRSENLLFALAFFLHQRGASDLWRQLLANGGQAGNFEMLQGLTRHALSQFSPSPILVIDDADILHPTLFETQNQDYVRLLGLLESLSQNVCVLFVGQRVALPDLPNVEIDGISLPALLEWYQFRGIDIQAAELERLLDYTSGTPRLLVLCLALLQNGTPIHEITMQFKRSAGAKPLVGRLINQMSEEERRILAELSVFRRSAPADAWGGQQSVLSDLSERGLVQMDLFGGVSLLSVWADLILEELPAETKAALHIRAAGVRAERGEYTEASYHYWQAGYPEQAVQLWYGNMEYAISSGQAASAGVIFNAILANRLPRAEQRALALIRARLAGLRGEIEKGLLHLNEVQWSHSRGAMEAHLLRGTLLKDLGDNFGSLREYQAGLDDLAFLTRQQVIFLTGRSARFKDEGDFQGAWRELKRARYLIEAFEGNLLHREGKPEPAMNAYLQAVEWAKELNDKTYLARTYTNIGSLLSLSSPDEAFPYLRLGLDVFEAMGNLVEAQTVRNNMAVVLMQSGKYAEALPLAQSVVEFALQSNNRPNASDAAVNLAEIFFTLGKFDETLYWAEVCMAQEQTTAIPYALNIIGLVENARKNFARAEDCFRQAIRDEASDAYIIACAWRGLGGVYQAQGQASPAKDAFLTAVGLFEQQQMPNEVERTRASIFV
jgi:tetratricopeptide (TPR) repeat protein